MSNIKEMIRAEIERRKRRNGKSYYPAMMELLSILGTLPDESEQPTMGYDEAYLNEKIAKASKSWKGVDVDKFMDEVRCREPVTDCNDLTGKKTFDDYLKASPSERRKMNMTEILGEERLAKTKRTMEPVTDCHGLEEEIKEQIYERFYDLDGIAVIGTSGYAEIKDMEDIARHFAEWGAEHLAGVRKMISDDLEEAAEKYQLEVKKHILDGSPIGTAKDAFIAGAEWQEKQDLRWAGEIHKNGYNLCKEQMMKGSVEGVVWGQAGKNINISVLKGVCKYLEQDDLPYNVRIIILPKEDEE